MVNLTIDGKQVQVQDGATILEAANAAGINIPTLCYLKEVNEIGACRVCVVEIEGEARLAASCNTACTEGMVVRTRSPRVLAARKTNVQLLLSQHNVNCTSCVRNSNCKLQEICKDLGITEDRFEDRYHKDAWDKQLPLVRDASKCIKCMRCVNVCDKIQGMGVWEVNGTGARTKIEVRDGLKLSDVNCALCGQCITHCPVGALHTRNDRDRFIDAVNDPEVVTVVQIAPAVRAAFGDAIGLPYELATEKRMAAAVKALGVDYVFDTNFTADLTIMEEGSELLEYLGKRKDNLPMFTSCCPGWVRFMKLEYPEYVHQLSTSKSPQQMFGAVTKSYFAEKIGVAPEKICCISIMPCSAKKFECDVPEVNDAADKDVDMVLTTRELGGLLHSVNVAELDEIEFDSPLGTGTGAAVIFGATGGVMEAALRSAYYLVTGENPDADAFKVVRAAAADKIGDKTWREAEVEIAGAKVRAAIASGLGNTRALMDAIISGEVQYDFVEIMACPGGCAGGGGQPIKDGCELATERGARLYELDKNNKLRFSHENPDVLALYEEYLEKPLSEKAEKLLHTEQADWTL